MIRYGLALVLLLLTVDTADACSRCGLFGSRCRFRKVSYPVRKVYVKKAVPSVVPQTIIINNAGTVPSVIFSRFDCIWIPSKPWWCPPAVPNEQRGLVASGRAAGLRRRHVGSTGLPANEFRDGSQPATGEAPRR